MFQIHINMKSILERSAAQKHTSYHLHEKKKKIIG